MTNIKIEKGVSLVKKPVYPLDEMKLGDSFLVSPCDDKERKRIFAACRFYLGQLTKPKFRFTSRVEGDGYRFWKVESKRK